MAGQIGYGMVDRYRMTAFEIFKSLIAAQRAADGAEVSAEEAETLVDESIKYAVYFTNFSNDESKYTIAE